MSTFPVAVQDLVAAVRHGPRTEVAQAFAEFLRASQELGPEEASWATLGVVELLAARDGRHAGHLAVVCTQCMIQGASPWVAAGLIVERLCEAVDRAVPGESRGWGDLDLLCQAAGPLLRHIPEARRLFRALGGTVEKLRKLVSGGGLIGMVGQALDESAGETFPPESPGETADAALRQLAQAVAPGAEVGEEIRTRLQELMQALFCVDRATRNRALAGLGRLIPEAGPGLAGELAQVCGSLVETGCDAGLAMDPVLHRLPDMLRSAERFLRACVNAPPGEGEAGEQGPRELLERHSARMAESMPAEARAWDAAGPLCLGAIALLARSPEKRKQVRRDADLLERAQAVAGCNGAAGFLARMLQVLDDEELLVLSPEPKVGFRVRIGGVGDNFQLHTLLAGAVVGPVEDGLFPGLVGTISDSRPEPPEPGRPLDPRAVGVARDLPCSRSEPGVYSHLQLWTWQALRPDGRLPDDPMANHDFVVWNEGVPADIPPFEGVRVILLGSTSFSRAWNGGRIFPFMTAYLSVEERLSPEVVDGWLRRISARAR
jgi:hypothetical protein